MYIFISHSSIDAKIAEEICASIEKNGHKCFIAPRDIRSGFEYAEEIINGIDTAEAFILVLSNNGNQSPHVLREVERAVSKNVPIIVYKLEDVELTKSMEYFLMTHQWINAKIGRYDDVVNAIEALSRKEDIPKEKHVENNKQNKYMITAIVAVCGIIVAFIIAIGAMYITKGNHSGKGDDNDKTVDATDKLLTSDAVTESATVESTEEATTDIQKADVELGDTVVFGRYLDEDIYWKVIYISDDTNEAVLISRDIITMKAYDTAESGKYNSDGEKDYWSKDSLANTDMELQAYVRGNSSWETSNIRAWLNSDKDTVKYEDQAPVVSAMSEHKNGYEYEAGFLTNFSDEELSAIKVSEVKTKGNALSEDNVITTKDKVFLLSVEELDWLDKASVNQLAIPTNACLNQDESNWYEMYLNSLNVKPFVWWLREPVEGTSASCYMVGNGYYEDNLWSKTVGLEGFGIRPAIRVDLQSGAIKVED